MTGIYTSELSDVGLIFTITLEQIVPPPPIEVAGIYEIDDGLMRYEVVQLSGTSNIAPTPETGFGSTNQGAFGDTNIQQYIRM